MRKWHRWVSIFIALPFLIIVSSGIILSTRGYNTWMQPDYQAKNTSLNISFPALLEAVKTVPQAGMQSWGDISQIDARPKTGQIRVRAKKDHWEVQVDGVSGAVTGFGQRRVAWFTSLHEGALFGEYVRYGIFFPSALGMFFLTLSGIWIFLQPYARKRQSTKKVKS